MADSTIPVKVAVRIRPLSSNEEGAGCQDSLDIVPGRPQIIIKNTEKAFTYDYAFNQTSQQQEVYDKAIRPLIDQLFRGYNATVLAYGQTGSGKTHSMGTCSSELTPLEQEGVIPRAVRDIFDRITSMKNFKFNVRIAFVELYKEQLYDLLSTQGKKKEDCAVDIREDPKLGVIIANLTEVSVDGLRSTLKQLEIGSLKRVTAATAMNNVSSRSHAIFTLYIEGTRIVEEDNTEGEEQDNSVIAKFHLVDLAGSERAKKTKATGVRYQEGVSINLGLLALGNVISALGEEGKSRNHIPYRDSKLTRLLQDSLGGNSYTLMIACVSPADSNIEETLCTLRYADRARKIKNLPIVNRDDKEHIIQTLKRELRELKAQLSGDKTGSVGSRISPLTNDEREEMTKLKETLSNTLKENHELTLALCACQEEMAYMNEKLILTERSSETMKNKLTELLAHAEQVCSKSEAKDDIRCIMDKICDVMNVQKASEKTLLDHEVSRHESTSNSTLEDVKGENEDDDGEDHQVFDAAHALKQNALANQLANLNKMLAQKEQLASTLQTNEANIVEIKTKYEENIKTMESELDNLVKEKDMLQQQLRSEPAANKIAEQRRKRIQELEQAIQDLRKKVTEQERIIKMNEKQAARVKQLADEIRMMKQQKVKLVKQMREDAEAMRIWKQKKEREVIKLKQNERKQQFQIARMENLHTKQQNVLRRKMEEAMANNKRLKEVLEKQKAARKLAPESKGGLAGAAERMRNFVTQELDMVVSVKEATQSRLQLLEDRKTLTKQLNELKRQTRYTMVSAERDALSQKMTELQSELDLRNDQIADLQKQIMSADQDKEKEGGRNWWDTSVSTMTEAKIALQYLFEKAAETLVSASATSKEVKELKQLYDEAVKNTAQLEDEINKMKVTQNEELSRAFKEYEERVTLLVSSLSNKESGIQESKLEQFSQLHKELLKMQEETEERQQKVKKEIRKPVKITAASTVNDDEEDEDDEEEEAAEDEEDVDSNEDDPDWCQTPLFRRIRKIRKDTAMARFNESTIRTKRKSEEGDDGDLALPADDSKRQKRSSSLSGACSCKTGCKTNRCACKKADQGCGDSCRCPADKCTNRSASSLPNGGDKRDSVGINDATYSADNTGGTMSLLNETFDVSVLTNKTNKYFGASSASPPLSPRKRLKVDGGENTPSSDSKQTRRPYFKSPREFIE